MQRNNGMKRNKLAMGLSLTILVAFLGNGIVLAKGGVGSTHSQANQGDPVQTHNVQNKGLKSPHSARKQAGKRLKLVYQQKHQQKLQKWAKSHHGYTGQGQVGDGFNNNQAPASNGGQQ
jgi:hypothetical protein